MNDALLNQFDPAVRYGLAFSGGVDSSFLWAFMTRAGLQVQAYYVYTAFQAPFELQDAKRVAHEVGQRFTLLDFDILSAQEVCDNPPDRCYHCKKRIFGRIKQQMDADGVSVLIDGTNATDDPARRPGFRALAELGVQSPLRAAHMTKDDIRAASRELALFTADKQNFSCFATKVPEGQPITKQALAAAAAAEGLEYHG